VSEEIRITDAATGGAKGMKPERLSLVPWDSVRAISRASNYGATKYADKDVGAFNWRRGYAWSLSYDACIRHLSSWWEGEDTDPESGLHHLWHAGWHCLALIWFTQHKPEKDDRPCSYPALSALPPAHNG
jgi:hypothetical protein